MIVAATAIGTSHIVLSPVAGARFGYALIWLVLFSHLFKYPAFDFGPRFAIANRVSLIGGFQAVPGPKNWALWVFLATTTLQGLTIFAAVISVTASILVVTLGGLPYPAWIVLLGFLILLLHRTGKYPALALGSKIALAILAVVSVIAFAAAPPRPSDLAQMFIPALPAGSVLLAASIFGLMPTGINVAIWHSLWAVEHIKEWEKTAKNKREMLELGMADLRVGYVLSAVLAVVFVSLGANLLKPRGLTPNGIDVSLTLSKIYTEILGDWMFPVFMLAAFAAMFSTSYSVMDGFPRTFASLLRTIFPRNGFLKKPANPAYWIFMAVIFAFGVVVNTLVPNPVLMVTLVGVVSLLVAPVLYGLNYYCVTRLIADESMRPSRPMRIWALGGIVIMTLAVGFSIYTRLG
jgi:Mn2+/Fe2+ NRAMP family transporter